MSPAISKRSPGSSARSDGGKVVAICSRPVQASRSMVSVIARALSSDMTTGSDCWAVRLLTVPDLIAL